MLTLMTVGAGLTALAGVNASGDRRVVGWSLSRRPPGKDRDQKLDGVFDQHGSRGEDLVDHRWTVKCDQFHKRDS